MRIYYVEESEGPRYYVRSALGVDAERWNDLHARVRMGGQVSLCQLCGKGGPASFSGLVAALAALVMAIACGVVSRRPSTAPPGV